MYIESIIFGMLFSLAECAKTQSFFLSIAFVGFPPPRVASMLPKISLYSIVVLLAAQVVTSQQLIDPVSCAGKVPRMTDSLNEAVNMAEFAYQRTIGLKDATLNYPDMRVTLNNFRAYFGTKAADGIAASGQTLISKPASDGS